MDVNTRKFRRMMKSAGKKSGTTDGTVIGKIKIGVVL